MGHGNGTFNSIHVACQICLLQQTFTHELLRTRSPLHFVSVLTLTMYISMLSLHHKVFHCSWKCSGIDVLKPFATSRSWLVYDESAHFSDTKLNKEQAVKHVALLTAVQGHSSCLEFTRSVGAPALKKLVGQVGIPQETSSNWVDDSVAKPVQGCEPRLTQKSQNRACREVPVGSANDHSLPSAAWVN